jgi:hypothetical protein
MGRVFRKKIGLFFGAVVRESVGGTRGAGRAGGQTQKLKSEDPYNTLRTALRSARSPTDLGPGRREEGRGENLRDDVRLKSKREKRRGRGGSARGW